ncbi:hypothetical protein LBBP_02719 [Leptospira borgpetersenii serovar Ballum]|uniref:Uncharacterized protein n=1 Tax=Leptospira borgpetersenii serovar Ballum TaxID=280505 RepID=A0A0S2ITF2_LEPBO|nr:hypothetical protein LBBP_02719 [Leptospira borgpetersenii serovar Ballum]
MFEFWKPWRSLFSNIGLPPFFRGKIHKKRSLSSGISFGLQSDP